MDTNDFSNKKTEDALRDITDKIKKITNALYRVTDLLSDKEPLKWALRNKAVLLYDNLSSFSFIKDKNFVLNETLNSFHQIVNVLELCSRGSAISNLNFEILKREYLNLKSYIEGNKNEIVSEGIFLLEEAGGGISPALPQGNSGIKKTEKDSVAKIKAFPGRDQVVSNPPVYIEDRKQKIIELLKNGEAKTISEIGAIFGKEVSSKTIQRDLVVLLKTGQVNAKGEKRWRSYFIEKTGKEL